MEESTKTFKMVRITLDGVTIDMIYFVTLFNTENRFISDVSADVTTNTDYFRITTKDSGNYYLFLLVLYNDAATFDYFKTLTA